MAAQSRLVFFSGSCEPQNFFFSLLHRIHAVCATIHYVFAWDIGCLPSGPVHSFACIGLDGCTHTSFFSVLTSPAWRLREEKGTRDSIGQRKRLNRPTPAIELITNKSYRSGLNADSLVCQDTGLTNDNRIGPSFNTAALARRPSRCRTTALKPRAQSKRCPISA